MIETHTQKQTAQVEGVPSTPKYQAPSLFVMYFALLALLLCGAMLLGIQTRLTVTIRENVTFLEDGTSIQFDTAIDGTGWYRPDNDGTVWTNANVSTIQLDPLPTHWYNLQFRANGLTDDIEDSLRVSLNNTPIPISNSVDEEGWSIFEGSIPPDLITNETMTLRFTVSGITSPEALGESQDSRLLGLRFDWLEVQASVPPVVQPFSLFAILFAVAAIGAGVSLQTRHARPQWSMNNVIFTVVVMSAIVAALVTLLVIPDIPPVQVITFVFFSGLLAFLVIIWAPTPNFYGGEDSLIDHLSFLWEKRYLLGLWTRYNIASRYSQAFLGIIWIILQPLATSLVLAFVFGQLLRGAGLDLRGVPFISFFLTALVPWAFFNQGLSLAANSLVSASGIMQKVYFPREIIILVKLCEALVDTAFTFMALIILNGLFMGIYPSASFIYLPLLVLIQTTMVLGLMFFVSYISMMIRDIPQLISIVLRFLFYLTPILYPGSLIPTRLNGWGLVNPLAPMIDAYREVILYNSAPDITTLYYPAVLSVVLLYTGYMFFKKNEKRLADFI